MSRVSGQQAESLGFTALSQYLFMAAEQAQLFSPASLGEAGDGNNALLDVLDDMSYELRWHWELYHSKAITL